MKSLLDWQTGQKRHLYLYDDRVIDVFLKSANWNYANGLQMIRFSLQFSVPDAIKRTISKYRSQTVIAGTAQEFNLVYNGSADSKPIISFIANQGGAITTCQLKNLTTSETINYFGTVPLNVALDIDCAEGTVFNSSINKIADFGASDFIRLVRGTNYFRFSGNPCTINIDYLEKYFN